MPPFMLDNTNADKSDTSSSDFEEENPKYQREPSPPHEEVLADNPDIAVSRWRVGHVLNRVSLLPIAQVSYGPRLTQTFCLAAVHNYVPRTIQRSLLPETHSLWPAGYRARRG